MVSVIRISYNTQSIKKRGHNALHQFAKWLTPIDDHINVKARKQLIN